MSNNITQLLRQFQTGDKKAESQLIDVVYPKLKQIAQRQMNQERKSHTLQATALINEVYLELFKSTDRSWDTHNDFFAYAATSMRHILVDHARKKNTHKRGGDFLQVTLINLPDNVQKEDELLMLDEALKRLSVLDERKSKIVELRFFGGLTIDEISSVVCLSNSAINKELKAARGWLFHKMKD